ncbi:cytochrome c [Roseobacter denitrificans]|uniref:Cytochrome c family protein, putative n=1 Tax=Roseobacter denitrificans (strain ATCC 33942 / OCh 114) TaxID=375451 RepID=Q167G1_ROSDO|nr:cytochrome c [Roseobacter denitrificans]ABG31882.1 cytochrome c family protein, putative [Roseobacter denitrificans OCh 114]AVL51435.1 cytochrome c [Roseobacter denitrificans]SFG42504.1 Cytochrome C oxidase, cbb3-type, subunit III [Roseobacter denitrificans OCh 114]
MTRWLLPAGVAGGLVALTSMALAPGSDLRVTGVTPDLARGEAIYAEACAACHGANLQGEPDWRTPGPDGRLPAPPHDATGHTWHHPDRLLLDITLHCTAAVVGGGYESNMPGFAGDYSEDALKDVLAWIKTQWPEEQRIYQANATARDEQNRAN